MDVGRWIRLAGRSSAVRSGAALALAALALGAAGCVTPFAEMQGARLVGPGRSEFTAGYSYVKAGDQDSSEKAQDDIVLQGATGVSDRVDLRARYELVRTAGEYSDGEIVNVIAAGPKIGIAPGKLALYTPVGVGFGGGIESSETWSFQPTLLFTLPVSQGFEINPSAKAHIWLNSKGADNLLAFNLGFGIGSDVTQWALRPEVGVLVDPQDHGHAWHFSLGISKALESRD